MINIIVLEYLGVPNLSLILPTYTKYCACHPGEIDDMLLQSSHCYSSSPMKTDIISLPDLITAFEYLCHNQQHVSAVYLVVSFIICCAVFQLPLDKNTPAFKWYVFLTLLDIYLSSSLSP